MRWCGNELHLEHSMSTMKHKCPAAPGLCKTQPTLLASRRNISNVSLWCVEEVWIWWLLLLVCNVYIVVTLRLRLVLSSLMPMGVPYRWLVSTAAITPTFFELSTVGADRGNIRLRNGTMQPASTPHRQQWRQTTDENSSQATCLYIFTTILPSIVGAIHWFNHYGDSRDVDCFVDCCGCFVLWEVVLRNSQLVGELTDCLAPATCFICCWSLAKSHFQAFKSGCSCCGLSSERHVWCSLPCFVFGMLCCRVPCRFSLQ